LSFSVASASAAEACKPKTAKSDTLAEGGNQYGVLAWCETGEGYIRAKASCTAEATLRKYTVMGNRVYSRKFGGDYMSGAWCRGDDALDKKGYVLG
jgi:hypothetical protein